MFKKRNIFIAVLIIATVGIAAFIPEESATSPTQVAEDAPPFFDGNDAFTFAEMQLGYGLRPTGSQALEDLRQEMIEILESEGWDVIIQEFEHNANGEIFIAKNIIARKGQGPITLIGSHYDSRMVADKDPVEANQSEGVPGANDGASSTGALLELAGVIDDHYDLTDRQIWLVFFDAEDNGNIPGWDWVIGSRYMASNLALLGITPDSIEFMLLLDMIGDNHNQPLRLERYSLGNAPHKLVALWQIAGELGYSDYFLPEIGSSITDDHVPFIELRIPSVDIIGWPYEYHHTVSDTLDKISPESIDRVGDVVEIYLLETGIIERK